MTLHTVLQLFNTWGGESYDEEISQLSHGLQCASRARACGADDSLVAAALLHDIGHLLELQRKAGNVDIQLNDKHDVTGYEFLLPIFGPSVADPIRWHVEAKRYLCATDPNYFALLSAASRRSLQFQGGAMSPTEVATFERLSTFADAVSLRRWDEQAKMSDAAVPSLTSYESLLRKLS